MANKVIFMGSHAIALPVLNWLHSQADIQLAAVVSNPGKPARRGQRITQNPVALWAAEKNITLFQPQKPGAELIEWIQQQGIQIALVMAYGHLLKNDFLNAPALGCLNLHASVLPKYRGATPIEGAIASGDAQTGVSLMQLVRAMDAGPVFGTQTIPIAPEDAAPQVYANLAQACAPLLAEYLPPILKGTAKATPQNGADATYVRKLTKADAGLNWEAPAHTLHNRIRALTGSVGSVLHLQSAQTNNEQGAPTEPTITLLKIKSSALNVNVCPTNTLGEDKKHTAKPGTVLAANENGVCIAAGGGTALNITHLQRPGGKPLPAADFLRGFNITPGQLCLSQPMQALVSVK